ncbi:unnamed protein product [Ilex paraguariensis]|uniref:Pentatricopeptide repeat-containing protein n=1 Tax=Ilex paraguariensis TaxID=185542 RepID=A0ABC8TRV3_9AQUA
MKREIANLVADGLYKKALCLNSQLHSSSLRPNKFTFPSLLKACAKLRLIPQSQMLHTHLVKTGFQTDIYTATALTDCYMKLHLLNDALKVFDEIPEPNMASFNVAISGFSRYGFYNEALRVVRLAAMKGFRPDSVSVASLLSACEYVEIGIQLQCWAMKIGVGRDIYAATSLVTMYMNFGELVSATKVFEVVQDKNVVCYNAFISGLLQLGSPRAVLDVFNDMRRSSGEEPNSVTLICIISACSDLKYVGFGRQVHGYIFKVEMSFDTMVGTALVDMYSKCCCWQRAFDVFKEMNGKRNLITWNSMITGMMLNTQSENAVKLFGQLETEGLKPDSATWNSMISGFSHIGKELEAFMFFRKMQSAGVMPSLKSITSLLPACSALSALQSGREIHGHVVRTYISNDEFIATALIDMYMKCGQCSLAHRVFDRFEIESDDPAIWNAMISGYGRNGEYETAFEIFHRMVEENVQPNLATFSCVLSVCSHTGQIDKGWQVFGMMSTDYGLKPASEHFNCMVDLLGRSGRLDEARGLLKEITEPSTSVYASLLGSCKCYSDSKLGEEMVKKLSELEPENPTPFVILSNIYAQQGRWKDVERVRRVIDERGLRKHPGFSLAGVT